MSLSPELRELALLYPLQLSYRDIRGERQRASVQVRQVKTKSSMPSW